MAENAPGASTDVNGTGNEEIRTLFISGLPVDVKERELHNLFRPYESYEGALIKFNQKLGIPIAFASFQNQAAALAAKEALHGIRFDPESSTELRLEMAKSNTRTKRLRDLQESSDSAPKRPRGSYGGYQQVEDPAYGAFQPPPQHYYDPAAAAGAWGGYGGYDAYGNPVPAAPAMAGYDMYGQPQAAAYGVPPPHAHAPPRGRGSDSSNPPNSTLFVANLASTTSEMELREVFTHVPGCRRVKVLQKPGQAPTAFLEFADVPSAVACKESMNGTYAHYTDRNGLRVEYAKRRMGQPGRFTDTTTFANPEGVHPNVAMGGVPPEGGLAALGGDAAASTYATGYTPTPIAPPSSGMM